MVLKPNTQCSDRYCRQRQKEFNERPKVEATIDTKADDAVVHSDNIYGIELVSEDEGTASSGHSTSLNVGTGLKLAYDAPDTTTDDLVAADSTSAGDDGASLEELMAQMKSI